MRKPRADSAAGSVDRLTNSWPRRWSLGQVSATIDGNKKSDRCDNFGCTSREAVEAAIPRISVGDRGNT